MTPQEANMTPKAFFRGIIILWMALLAGLLMISFVIIFVIGNDGENMMMPYKSQVGLFFYVALFLMATCLFLSNWIYNQRLQSIPFKGTLEEKLAHFREATILRCAFIEGASLTSIVFMMIENNLIFFVIAAVGIFFLLKARPDLATFKEVYQLTSAERSELE